jgi:hypothetical protein
MWEIYSDGEKIMSNVNFQMQQLVSESKVPKMSRLKMLLMIWGFVADALNKGFSAF